MACTRNDRFVRAHLAHGALRRGRTACAPRFRFRRNGAPVPEIWVRIGKFTLRSEERRVGEEGRYWWGADHFKQKKKKKKTLTMTKPKREALRAEVVYCFRI